MTAGLAINPEMALNDIDAIDDESNNAQVLSMDVSTGGHLAIDGNWTYCHGGLASVQARAVGEVSGSKIIKIEAARITTLLEGIVLME